METIKCSYLSNVEKKRYGLYKLIRKDKKWCVISRSGMILDNNPKIGLLSGMIYNDLDQAMTRYQTLINSAQNRRFRIMGTIPEILDYKMENEWVALEKLLAKKETKKEKKKSIDTSNKLIFTLEIS